MGLQATSQWRRTTDGDRASSYKGGQGVGKLQEGGGGRATGEPPVQGFVRRATSEERKSMFYIIMTLPGRQVRHTINPCNQLD